MAPSRPVSKRRRAGETVLSSLSQRSSRSRGSTAPAKKKTMLKVAPHAKRAPPVKVSVRGSQSQKSLPVTQEEEEGASPPPRLKRGRSHYSISEENSQQIEDAQKVREPHSLELQELKNSFDKEKSVWKQDAERMTLCHDKNIGDLTDKSHTQSGIYTNETKKPRAEQDETLGNLQGELEKSQAQLNVYVNETKKLRAEHDETLGNLQREHDKSQAQCVLHVSDLASVHKSIKAMQESHTSVMKQVNEIFVENTQNTKELNESFAREKALLEANAVNMKVNYERKLEDFAVDSRLKTLANVVEHRNETKKIEAGHIDRVKNLQSVLDDSRAQCVQQESDLASVRVTVAAMKESHSLDLGSARETIASMRGSHALELKELKKKFMEEKTQRKEVTKNIQERHALKISQLNEKFAEEKSLRMGLVREAAENALETGKPLGSSGTPSSSCNSLELTIVRETIASMRVSHSLELKDLKDKFMKEKTQRKEVTKKNSRTACFENITTP